MRPHLFDSRSMLRTCDNANANYVSDNMTSEVGVIADCVLASIAKGLRRREGKVALCDLHGSAWVCCIWSACMHMHEDIAYHTTSFACVRVNRRAGYSRLSYLHPIFKVIEPVLLGGILCFLPFPKSMWHHI